MKIEIEEHIESDKEWNSCLKKSPTGSVYQTSEYASYVQFKGNEPKFLKFVEHSGKIIGQLLVYFSSRFEKKGYLGNLMKKIPGSKKDVCRWIYGPVIFEPEYKQDVYITMQKYLLEKKCLVMGSEHPLSENNFSQVGNSFDIRNWATFLIDLSLDKSTLWENLDKHSARKNIERSEKRGVKIKTMTHDDLTNYHRILNENKLKNDWNIPIEEVIAEWEMLQSTGFNGFMAFINEEPISGLVFSSFNNYINEWGVARTEKDYNSKLYSQDLIKWKIIEWGLENNCNYYDLSGVNPSPNSDKESKIFRYKKKWGGKFTEYATYSL